MIHTHKELTIQERIAMRPPGMEQRPAEKRDGANPDCRLCGGFGWRSAPQYNGNWFACACTVESRSAFLNGIKPQVDLSAIGLREDELTLHWGTVKAEISDGLKAVEAVRPAYERGHGMIFLWGNYGQAKTLIGKILTVTAYRDGKRAAYANMSGVLANIRMAFDLNNQNQELNRRIQWWTGRDVLFLDELDKVNGTPWAMETLFTLLDQRYVRAIREEALTVVASNATSGALDGYLNSRLQDKRLGPVVHLNGPDGRKVMPKGYRF